MKADLPDVMDHTELDVLSDIMQALTAPSNVRTALHRALERLRNHGILRGTVMLLRPDTSELSVEASTGLPHDGELARYKVGEGITGTVFKTGKPVVVPQVSKEPMFLNRAGQRNITDSDVSFVCVPILIANNPIGTLGVDLPFLRERDYDRSVKFLTIVGAMLSQSVKVQTLLDSERQRLLAENVHLQEELRERYDFSHIIGTSGRMRKVYEQIVQVAPTNTTALIRGESGTGKELIAHAIHYNSPRAKKSFIRVSCAAFPDTLIESELFGYEKGAFTGAIARKKGRFEMAEGGTLFLDEIGEISPAIQVKLLRVLQEKEFERLGGTETLRADVRLITATNKNLEKAMTEGTFREDLYYRLNVFTILVPPLRERKPDIMLLADYFLEKYAKDHTKNIKRISTPAIDMLTSYHWPGNVRELQNIVERAVLVCDTNVIHGHHLPPSLQTAEASGTVTSMSMLSAVGAYEKDLIQDALKTTRGHRTRAAELLAITPRIINYKIKKYGIDCDRFRVSQGTEN
jgi:Nif-specific regulatory protein